MPRPMKGWLVLWGGGWEGTGDTWAIGPGPKWVAEQGWESGPQGTEGDSQAGLGGFI